MSLQILHKTATLASVRVAGSVTRLCKHSFGSSSRGRDGAIDFLYVLCSVHIQLSFSTAAAPSMIQNTTVCNVPQGSMLQTCPRLKKITCFIDCSHTTRRIHITNGQSSCQLNWLMPLSGGKWQRRDAITKACTEFFKRPRIEFCDACVWERMQVFFGTR
jgi:hypothetical protein